MSRYLGDQLSWEQVLSQCQDKSKLWIITRDGDYASEHQGRVFLNAELYQELAKLHQTPLEVFCFNNIPEGIKHFADTTHVKTEALPTPEETEQIKKEQESLPPGWLTTSYFNDAASAAVLNAYRQRASRAHIAALSSMPILPPQDS